MKKRMFVTMVVGLIAAGAIFYVINAALTHHHRQVYGHQIRRHLCPQITTGERPRMTDNRDRQQGQANIP